MVLKFSHLRIFTKPAASATPSAPSRALALRFAEDQPNHFGPRWLRVELPALGIKPIQHVGLEANDDLRSLPRRCRAAPFLC